jgi:hypothetical protein
VWWALLVSLYGALLVVIVVDLLEIEISALADHFYPVCWR